MHRSPGVVPVTSSSWKNMDLRKFQLSCHPLGSCGQMGLFLLGYCAFSRGVRDHHKESKRGAWRVSVSQPVVPRKPPKHVLTIYGLPALPMTLVSKLRYTTFRWESRDNTRFPIQGRANRHNHRSTRWSCEWVLSASVFAGVRSLWRTLTNVRDNASPPSPAGH